MKNLKDIFTEGILADPELSMSKSAYEILYPVPTIKDFVKRGALGVEWYCPKIVQKYIELSNDRTIQYVSKDKFVSIGAYIFNDKSIQLVINQSENFKKGLPIRGLHFDSVSDYKTAKQCVIDLFNYIVKNPDIMKTLIEHANEYEYNNVGELNVSKIIKK